MTNTQDTRREEKKCKDCHKVKPLDDFYKDARGLLGRFAACKPCQNKRLENSRRKNLPKLLRRYRSNSIRYASDPSNRVKIQGRRLTKAALARGEIIKQPCQKCGNPKVEGHHEDYTKPLDILWLCKKHHTERHLELRK